jgi:hypothetical protein
MDISDIEIKESGRFALMGKVAEEHAEDDFTHANEDLIGQPTTTLTPDQYDIVGYVDDKDAGNAIARAGGFQRDGKPVFVGVTWRSSARRRTRRPSRRSASGTCDGRSRRRRRSRAGSSGST